MATGHHKLGFSADQNKVLLAVGQYVYAFSYLDMAIMFSLSDRMGGNHDAVLVALRGMDFRVRSERLFQISKSIDKPPPLAATFDEFTKRIRKEISFRNDVVHSQIGIEHDGSGYLNSFGKGIGQARHTQQRVETNELRDATQRCWRLFLDVAEVFTPLRYAAFVPTLNDDQDRAL